MCSQASLLSSPNDRPCDGLLRLGRPSSSQQRQRLEPADRRHLSPTFNSLLPHGPEAPAQAPIRRHV